MICRLLYMCLVLALFQSTGSAYAQNSASVPVTITLEAPSSASETSSPTLVVDPTELTVQTGGIGRYYVRLSPIPTGPVSVTYRVIDAPTGGDESHLTSSPESLSFTTTNWRRDQVVTVTAATNALEGEYTIELTPIGGGVTDKDSVTVTVKEGLTLGPIPRIVVEVGKSSGPWGLRLVVTSGQPRWGTVTTTLSIREPGNDYVSAQPSTLTYTVDEYNSSKSVTFTATADAVPGYYTLVQTASRVGYNNVQQEGTIQVIPNQCAVTLSKDSDLNFGQWRKDESDGIGWVTVNAWQRLGGSGSISKGHMINAGGTSSVGRVRLSTNKCRQCSFSSSPSQGGLKGQSGHSIAFNMGWQGWDEDGGSLGGLLRMPSEIGLFFEYLPPTFTATFQFGGDISGITFETPPDNYRGTINAQAFCE